MRAFAPAYLLAGISIGAGLVGCASPDPKAWPVLIIVGAISVAMLTAASFISEVT
jgi:hypothetical protein